MPRLRVGIDLVNVSRIREFLNRHSKERVDRLLSEAEKKRFHGRKFSPRVFAQIFAAKEAFFKTLDLPWMGLEGFAGMQTVFLSHGQFRIKLLKSFPSHCADAEAVGTFFSENNLIGAQIIRWEKT